MKRSEMIKAMVDAAMKAHYGEAISEESFPARLAATMLAECEKVGMLPPGTVKESKLYPAHYVITQEDGTLVGGRMVNEWEPE